MANIERTYTIPLRKEWLKSVRYKRAKKAVRAVREFLARHMKSDDENIRLGKYINLELWKHGIQNPPSRIKINVTKDDKGIVKAELFGAPVDKKKEEPKKGAKKAEEKKPEAPEKKAEVPAKAAEEKKAEPKPVAPKAPAPAPVKQAPAPKQQAGQIIR